MDKIISRDFFNQAAATWDATARNNDPEKLYKMVKRLNLPTDGWILDVGTGTGVFLPFIQREVNGKNRLVSMDYAINMLAIAKNKPAGKKGHYLCAEIETLRFIDGFFDCVICYSTFPHFHDKPAAIKNIFNILKPGGRLYICHTASREFINQIHINMADFQDHLIPEDEEMRKLILVSGFNDPSIEACADSYLLTAIK
jgi:ubiquinone/menaquinone biosynthesis C-methylase UbiE